MEDYAEVEVKGAWSKTTDRSFRLKIRAISDKESSVLLTVRLTATYPRSAPILEVQGLDAFHERTRKRIQNIVQKRSKELLGDVMISQIADEIQDALEDAVQARQSGALPSLDDERASAEEVAATLAKQAEEAEARRIADEEDDQKRMLQRMVDQEINRRDARKPTKQSVEPKMLSFDRPATLQINNETATFASVVVDGLQWQNPDQGTCLARPNFSGAEYPLLVAVKRFRIQKGRDEVMHFESMLESLQRLSDVNVARLLAYRFDKIDDQKYDLVICTENMDRGTLHTLLVRILIGERTCDTARQLSRISQNETLTVLPNQYMGLTASGLIL